MGNTLRDLRTIDNTTYPYIFEKNVTINLKSTSGVIRCNIYRPKSEAQTYPVLVTYGPYGKDIPYQTFHPTSYAEVNPRHKSEHSAWELPDPGYWTAQGYAIVRVDERGLGQSPGLLDTMSRSTSEAFFDAIEWAAVQPWSTGKVGLLGISYYAGSQWRVAALRPKGLCAMIPWEGMSDYYRDRCRHGGILSNNFIKWWWERQVLSYQYGKAGRWGDPTFEGDLDEAQLALNRNEQPTDNENNRYRDDKYYASKEYNLNDIEVPLLSVANWGGILLHLRGNVEGFTHAGSRLKFLRFITGRHDLPFFYQEEVEVQKSFLDAFLKGEDGLGWTTGKVPRVSLVLRQGDAGFNNPEAEKAFSRRSEAEWPLARTQYTRFYLTPEQSLTSEKPVYTNFSKVSYRALGTLANPEFVHFVTPAFTSNLEITGHVVASLNVSMNPYIGGPQTSEIDVFVTLRHISATGKEVFYTGTAGDPVPLCKGWLRVSLRQTDRQHPRHRTWLPYRDYFSTSALPVLPGEIYAIDVEVWPTNVVLEPGSRLVFEVASGDTQGCDRFQHTCPKDRSEEKLAGWNHINFGVGRDNYITLPVIPSASL